MAIQYGVIGTGWITDSWISAASKSGKWQLSAVYSRTKEQAETFASKHGCTNTHTRLESLAGDKSVQAVYVASPNNMHHAQAKQMLQAGKHVILEKPATSTPGELDELLGVASDKGVFLIEAYRHIQEANFLSLKRMVMEEKRLGQVYGASFTYASYSSRYNDVLAGKEPNIFSLQHSGGSLVDIGVYPVTFAVALFGAPKSQTYMPFICRTGVDGGGVVILSYDGFGVQINQAKCYTSTAPCEVYGEKGTIIINGTTDLSSMKLLDAKTKQSEELAGPYKTVEKPNVNMEEECTEFARIIGEKDSKAAESLAQISRDVVRVTSDLRRQVGVRYPADGQ